MHRCRKEICEQLAIHESRPANLESKKILRFLYLYCSIAVCSKKKLVDAMLRPKKKKSRLLKLEIRDIRATNREILSNEG